MPLISCPECTQQVSDSAAMCPKCGHPINAEPVRVATAEDSVFTRNRNMADVVIFGPLLFLGFLIAAGLIMAVFS